MARKKRKIEKKGFFSCPGSSIPDLGGEWLTATLEFQHKEWLLRLETLQSFEKDKKTKRQNDKKKKTEKDRKRQRDKKDKKDKIQNKTKRRKHEKTKRQLTKTQKTVQYCDVRAVSHSCDVLIWDDPSGKLCKIYVFNLCTWFKHAKGEKVIER